ncbi:hypothetical protein FHX37_0645 [Haloactinospora alba]|uniref:TPR repeat domain-containing protein n=1 Tax=Haloactinospora alba TaxID=405555 RepID=A0A543NG47_9ACTN|nr:hypothetical protein [Haloactinospora alba]TQN30761.1 hypothetical protein FHX37_0645 [Haloactinospora alba]
MPKETERLANANSKALSEFDLSFSPKDTDADPDVLRDWAEDMSNLSMRILGRSGDLGGDFDKTAINYTEAIQWKVKDQSSYNRSLWEDSAYAVNYCKGETKSFAEEVENFKNERDDLIEEWIESVKAAINKKEAEEKDGDDPDYRGGIVTGIPRESVAQSQLEKDLKNLREKDKKNWENFIDAAEEHGSRLSEGPSPENVKRLVDEGHVAWSAYNIKGKEAPIPVSPDKAPEHAKALDPYLGKDGKEPDAQYYAAIATLQAITNKENKILEHSKNHKKSIKYLEKFYSQLEGQSPSLKLPHYLAEDKNQVPSLQTYADGILILSNEDYGGGIEKLPQSIQNVSMGPMAVQERDDTSSYFEGEWKNDIPSFGNLMSESTEAIEGGTVFSTYTTQAMGRGLDNGIIPGGETKENDIRNILDMSLRNENSNKNVLESGSLESNPLYDREKILSGLFTHEWNDDGKTVAGLTDWISRDAGGNEEEQERAGRAAYNLIDALTDENTDLPEELRNTGVTIEVESEKYDDKKEVSDAAFTQVNGELGGSLAKIFFSRLEDFTLNDVVDEKKGFATVRDVNAENHPDFKIGDKAVHAGTEQKIGFVELIAHNKDLAPNIMTSVDMKERDLLDSYLKGEGGEEYTPQSAARLRAVADEALINSFEKKLDNENEARAKVKELSLNSYNSITAGGGAAVGIANPPAGAAIAGISQLLRDPFTDFTEYAIKEGESGDYNNAKEKIGDKYITEEDIEKFTMEDRTQMQEHVYIQSLQSFQERDILTKEDLEKNNILDKEGNLEISPAGTTATFGAIRSDIMENIGKESAEDLGNRIKKEDENMKSVIDEYISQYEKRYDGTALKKSEENED